MNPLPPQAYTKETLLKAYSWVMNQNPSIKDMASTPDILVSLYLKATRDGESALDRPSIQNFKKELKSLAGMMGELDRVPVSAQTQIPTYGAPPSEPFVYMPASAVMPTIQAEPKIESKVELKNGVLLEFKFLLDPSSLEMIREVKSALNLSSDTEALRMLIKIGHTRSQILLK